VLRENSQEQESPAKQGKTEDEVLIRRIAGVYVIRFAGETYQAGRVRSNGEISFSGTGDCHRFAGDGEIEV